MNTIEQIKDALQAHIAEAEAATPGPWDVNSKYVGRMADATFIAHARTMSPAACKCLLLAIEWLEETAKDTTLVQHGEDSDNQPYISSFPTSEASQAKRRLASIRQEWHNLTTK
jgi:hypothetical protein